MIARRSDALWIGWGGTIVFLCSWLLIARISALSFLLWAGLMVLGAVMCFYGGVQRSKWFFLPGCVAVVVMAGVLLAVVHGR